MAVVSDLTRTESARECCAFFVVIADVCYMNWPLITFIYPVYQFTKHGQSETGIKFHLAVNVLQKC